MLSNMGVHTTDELIELAYQRLGGLDASLEKLSVRDPLRTTMRHEFMALYKEVHDRDFDRLRTRLRVI